jgi:hypothetical protein
MHGAKVVNGTLVFTAEYCLEWIVLSYGAKGARMRIRKKLKKLSGPEREAALKMSEIPVVAPTSRDEVYERAYALLREAGRGVGEDLLRMEYPSGEKSVLADAMADGFFAKALKKKDRQGKYVGAARLLYGCGNLIADLIASVSPEKKGEPAPDIREHFAAFWRGVYDVTGGAWNEQ